MKDVKFNTAGKTAAQVVGFIQLAIGDDMPHEKFCGNGVETREYLMNGAIRSKFIFVTESGMISTGSSYEHFKNHKNKEVDHLGNEVKPRTKTEYVECGFDNAWEYGKAFEEGVKLLKDKSDNFPITKIGTAVTRAAMKYPIYRKVEKEIDWREEISEGLGVVFHTGYVSLESPLSEIELIKLSRLVESLTRHIEID